MRARNRSGLENTQTKVRTQDITVFGRIQLRTGQRLAQSQRE
jgi:hypothetical protein